LSYSKYADAGQWTSRITDVDYCMQCGKEKISGSNLHLIRYYGNSTTTKPVQNNTVENKTVPKPKSPVEQAKSTFLSKAHLNVFELF